MSAPNAVAATPEVPPNISGGLTLLAKRLLPAKLNVHEAAGKKNGHVFNSWAIAKGLRLSAMTAQAIAEEFYRAVQADVQQQFPQLVWDIPPKALTREQSKAPAKVGDTRESSTFEQKAHEGDAALKAQKLQDQAKRRCLGLVERFAPIRRGRLQYELRDSMQKEWRDQIDKTKDWVSLERAIVKKQQETYDKLERAEQRLQ